MAKRVKRREKQVNLRKIRQNTNTNLWEFEYDLRIIEMIKFVSEGNYHWKIISVSSSQKHARPINFIVEKYVYSKSNQLFKVFTFFFKIS